MTSGLGAYAGTVLGAYAAAAALIGGIVVMSILRAARVRRTLDALEARTRGRRDGR
jgi:heme exporter protein CcmD